METWPRPKTSTAASHAAEVVLDALGGLARRDAREHLGVERLQVDPDRLDAAALSVGEPAEVVRRLELHLDRQAAGLLDRRRALGHVERPAVGRGSASRW